MERLPLIGAIVALLAAIGVLYWFLAADGLQPEPTELLAPAVEEDRPDNRIIFDKPKMGGVYAGTVFDRDDRPLHGAKVLLIAYNAGDAYLMNRSSSAGSDDDEAPLPMIGDYVPAGETVTDEQGHFRIAADAQARISRVMAFHPGHFLDVVGVSAPREDLVLRLPRAGRVIGTVLDDETGSPIHGAVVDIYLQQRVERAPELEQGVSYGTIKRKTNKLAWLATLGRFIPKVIGPLVYGLPWEGGETLRLRTDRNGHFEIGPLGDAIQLEFIVTHPQYKWHDYDTKGGKETAKRTVVGAGETVRREFRMLKGEFVAGQVVDDTGAGVPDVLVEVQSISAYYRHWWYRHKWRRTMTDKKGRFRAEGLARGTQQIVLRHDAFGSIVESADAGTDNLVIVVERLGGIQGRVTGAPGGGSKRKVTVMIESTDEKPTGPRQRREKTRLDKSGEFVLSAVAPGSYRVWLQAGKQSSLPVDVTVEPQQVAQVDFELGGGGTIMTRISDGAGGVVDPASVRLIAAGGTRERSMGTFVSREGEISIDGIAPGTYRLRAQGSGRIPVTTDIFEVARDRSTVVPPIQLREWAFVKFGAPVNERGRAARLTGDVIVEVREGEKGKFRRLHIAAGAAVPVKPGPVFIRARMGEVRFEERIDAADGSITDITIVFPEDR